MIFARRQIQSLQDAGLDVEVYEIHARLDPMALTRDWFALRERIATWKPDLVHAQYGTVTAALATSLGVPCVVTFRGSDLNPIPGINRVRSRVSHALSQLAAARADEVICVSHKLRMRLLAHRESAHVIPSGIDLDLFKPISRDDARRELGWPLEGRVVLFNAGRHPENKRLGLAEEAFALARRSLDGARLVVLNGSVEPAAMPLHYAASDCALLTSRFEGSPNVVREALACNLPVVAVDVGDVSEWLRGVSPSMVVGDDAASIAAALVAVLEVPTRSNGRQRVQSAARDAVARRIIEVYHQALEGP
jgi:glycosyltransferase involved in cell wall biosynthesis